MARPWGLRASFSILVLLLSTVSIQQTTTPPTSASTPSSTSPSSTTNTPLSTTTSPSAVTTPSTSSPSSKSTASTTSRPYSVIPGNGTVPSALPSHTDDGNGGGHHKKADQNGLVNYYFVFLALVLAVIGIFVFFFIRHKRIQRLRVGSARERALQQDLARGPGRRSGGGDGWRYHRGRGRSGEVMAEEGLNEHGEAPPPYMPKRSSEEQRRNGTVAGTEGESSAIPLQTLSPDGAAVKPPEYEAAQVRPTETRPSEPDPTPSGENSSHQPPPPSVTQGERDD